MKKRIIHFFVLSCKQATLLTEKQAAGTLSRRERMQLRWHLRLCDYCMQYKKQTEWLNKIIRNINGHGQQERNTDELEERIIHKIEEQTKS